jgi:hypothetical protein
MEEYREVFALIRLMPTCQTDAPAPMPAASRSFFVGAREMSPQRKALAVAMILLSAGVASYTGYSLGLGDGPSEEALAQRSAQPLAHTMDVISKPAGRRLRRAHDGLSNLAWFANEAPSIADPGRAVETFGDVLTHSPLVEDARALRSLDHNSLGTWQNDVHRFCDETIEAVSDVRRALEHKNETPAARLVRARRVMLERDTTAKSLLRLSKVAHCFDALPWHTEAELGVVNELQRHRMSGFSEALLSIMSGRSRRGVMILDKFQRTYPESPLHPSALLLLQRLQSHWPQGLQIQRGRVQQIIGNGNGSWSAIINNRGGRGHVRIIIRGSSSTSRKQGSRKL